MKIVFSLSHSLLRHILEQLHTHPFHVAMGQAGVSWQTDETLEFLAQPTVQLRHEVAPEPLPISQNLQPCFEIGFVPYRLNRAEAWHAMEWSTRISGNVPTRPTLTIALGRGTEQGWFIGLYWDRDSHAQPIHHIRVEGTGMHRLLAVDFAQPKTIASNSLAEERWSRVIGAYGGREPWERWTNLTIAVVGTGRTGSLLATSCIKNGAKHLILIDPDRLERHNLDAMDGVEESDLGEFKVQALAKNLRSIHPDTDIIPVPYPVLSALAWNHLKHVDIVMCCVDDDAARVVVGALAACYLKPLLDIGTGVFRESRAETDLIPSRVLGGDVRLILPGREGCLLCWDGVTHLDQALQTFRGSLGPPRQWQEERAGSLRSLNQVAAHLGLRLVEDVVTGHLGESAWLRIEQEEGGLPTWRSIRRLPAESLEQAVMQAVIKVENDEEHEHMWGHGGLEHDAAAQHAAWRQRLRRVEVGADHLCLTVTNRDAKVNDGLQPVVDAGHHTTASPIRVLTVPWTLVRRGGRTELRLPGVPTQPKSQFHEALIAAVVRALQWKDDVIEGRIPSIKALAQREQLDRRYVMRVLRLSFLAPDLIEAILMGWQPPELTLERFRRPIPLEWAMQRQYFSFPSSSSVKPQRVPKS